MAYELRWGNRTWIYALALGLGIGMAVLLLFKDMLGEIAFWSYYSPMLGYYVLISICQSHYFRREPKPDMGGLFRQFVSIFGAIVIFFLNQAVMESIFVVPDGFIMAGHFTFIVFGFFIYGFDDFMFKGKLLGWMKNDTTKAFFWYFFIWLIWVILFYSDFGISKAHSKDTWDGLAQNRMLAISQWAIIMSLLYALLFKDWLPELQNKLRLKNDIVYGIFLLLAAFIIGGGIAYLLFTMAPYISPEGYDSLVADPGVNVDSDMWHHILYMGTFPLIPAILIGVYTKNFNHLPGLGERVIKRLMIFIPSVIILYFAYHWLIARPEVFINYFFDDAVKPGLGLFGESHHNWYHQLDLYFNFTVSIIPLTHHWFCGRYGFVREVDDEEPESPPRSRRPVTVDERRSRERREVISSGRPVRASPRERFHSENERDLSRREWR